MIIVEVEGGVVDAVYNHSKNKKCKELVVGEDYQVDDHDEGDCEHEE